MVFLLAFMSIGLDSNFKEMAALVQGGSHYGYTLSAKPSTLL